MCAVEGGKCSHSLFSLVVRIDRIPTRDALLGVPAERQACARSSMAVSNINRELRRLQGPDRLWLEDHRRGNPSRRTLSGMKEEGRAAAVR